MEEFLYHIREKSQTEEGDSQEKKIAQDVYWVRGINKGDHKAFEAIYRYYFSNLAQFVLRYVGSKRAAEDLIQNVFSSLWENREKVEPKGTLRAYLYSAARYQAYNHISRKKGGEHINLESLHSLESKPAFPEEQIEYKEFSAAFYRAVQQMPEKRRHIYLLHRENHLTYREIADVLNISIKTVETQMSRSIKYLTKKLSHFRD